MKRILYLILAIFILSLPSNTYPGWYYGGAGIACPTCASQGDADIFCEDFEGSQNPDASYTCTSWTETIETGNTVTRESHGGTLACTDKGSYAFQAYATDAGDAGDEDAYAYKDITDAASVYVNFYFRAVGTNVEAGDYSTIMALYGNNGATKLAYLWVNYLGNVTLSYRNDAHGNSNLTGTATSPGTWYRARIWWTNADDAAYQIDALTKQQAADNDDMDIDRILIGIPDDGSAFGDGDAWTIQIDIIKIDDDTMPGACL